MRSEMAKMDTELKEVKEKLCTLAAPVGESKNEGQLNYTIKVILLNRKFSRSKHVLYVRERSSYLKEIQFFNLNNLWNSLCGALSFPLII